MITEITADWIDGVQARRATSRAFLADSSRVDRFVASNRAMASFDPTHQPLCSERDGGGARAELSELTATGGSGVHSALFWGHFRSNRILKYSACILVVSVMYPNVFEDTCIYLRIFVVF